MDRIFSGILLILSKKICSIPIAIAISISIMCSGSLQAPLITFPLSYFYTFLPAAQRGFFTKKGAGAFLPPNLSKKGAGMPPLLSSDPQRRTKNEERRTAVRSSAFPSELRQSKTNNLSFVASAKKDQHSPIINLPVAAFLK